MLKLLSILTRILACFLMPGQLCQHLIPTIDGSTPVRETDVYSWTGNQGRERERKRRMGIRCELRADGTHGLVAAEG